MAYIGAGITRFNTADGLTVKGTAEFTDTVVLGDSDELRFGNGADLKIYHDASNSYIQDAGTGALILRSNSFQAKSADNTTTMFTGAESGAVELYYNNVKRIETTGSGATITGGLGVSGNVGIGTNSPAGPLEVHKSGGDANVFITTGVTTSSTTILFGDSASDDRGRVHYDHNNDSMRLHTAGSERMRIDSSGNVGIGGSAVLSSSAYNAASLHLRQPGSTTTGGQLRFTTGASGHNASDGAFISYFSDNNLFYNNQESGDHRFFNGGSETLRITSGGNVGIGTTATTGAKLKVDGGSTAGTIIQAGNAQGGVILGAESSTAYINTTSATPLAFEINNTERMRLDASGNLLVGKTASGVANSGAELQSSGFTSITRDGGPPLQLNRKTSDGDIAVLKKDGTTVGSISSSSGKIAITLDPRSAATTGSGFLGGDGAIFPSDKTGVASDADVSLGGASTRFKDLHLSSNIYLGGSGGTSTIFSPTSLAIDIDSNNDQTDRAFVIKTGSNNIARFTESGRLGLGTTSPSAPLHVQTTSQIVGAFIGTSSDPQIYLGDAISSDNAFIMGYDRADNRGYLTVAGDSDSAFTIINGGDVGIGGLPSQRLHVHGGAVQFTNTQNTYLQINTTDTHLYTAAAHPLRFGTNSTERAQINSNGVFQVGKTDASLSTAGSYHQSDGFIGATRSAAAPLGLNRLSTDGNIVFFQRAGNTVGSIGINSSGVNYNTTSDIRLKTDIEPIDHATDMLMAMNPVSHRWKADPDADAVVGFIAQEMQEIVPEAVSKGDSEDDMWSMDYGRITPVLVAALQDAHKKIKQLEQRIAKMDTVVWPTRP
jgi:hypothetical protein